MRTSSTGSTRPGGRRRTRSTTATRAHVSRPWSEREPVTLFGAWFNATDSQAARAVFQRIAESFGDIGSSAIDLVAADVSGDLAYTVHREITSTNVDGVPSDYVLRVTQVYRREDGAWKVVHPHANRDPEET